MISAHTNANGKEEDEIPEPERPPSPPLYTTPAARNGVHIPTFSAFRPRDIRIPAQLPMTSVAWNCDGRKLAAVGIDKIVRVFQPEKSMEMRSASLYTGGHLDEVDYVAWNPTHPELFCTSSQRDRRIVFWDARQSRYIQQIPTKYSPSSIVYAPDGRSLITVGTNNFVYSLALQKSPDTGKEQWQNVTLEATMGSTALFNHTGDATLLSHHEMHSVRVVEYPSMAQRDLFGAHVGGCVASALDPRGRYLATGGNDSIVNLYDVNDWLCVRTITCCEASITGLSFSHDGEFLAISSQANYIDICATETGIPLHRVPAPAPMYTVAWHPSKYVIAYCGQTKPKIEGGSVAAVLSLFGPGM